ncbi:MAG: hypothetical protein DMG21_20370 [Acidobacteria bacterium]|nr:MAG: hypothetical protein DMG21_20370 [Acidobacteriota bacterium]
MTPAGPRYTVAVVGVSTLLGKEVLEVLKERKFPVANLVSRSEQEAEPDLPVLDLDATHLADAVEPGEDSEPDFVFLAGRLATPQDGAKTEFLLSAERLAEARHAKVIDLGGFIAAHAGGVLSIPSLEEVGAGINEGDAPPPKYYAAPHPAVVVIARLLLALGRRFPVTSAVCEVIGSASEIGPRAIAELQKQTVNLLSFQKIPQAVFGGQMAFNLLPRLKRGRIQTGEPAPAEERIRAELRDYLGARVPPPAVRFLQAPVFHSLAISLYVRLRDPAPLAALGETLGTAGFGVRRPSEAPPSPVEVTGSSDILVDTLAADPADPTGCWIWAVADNLRLAATNAVEIAESLKSVRL